MKFRRLVARAILIGAVSAFPLTCTHSQAQLKQFPEPLAEQVRCADKVEQKCECKKPETLISRLIGLIKSFNVVVVGEGHASGVSHYGEIASQLNDLYALGVRKIFVELDVSLNKTISQYQKLRRTLIENPDMDEKKSGQIIHKMASLLERIGKELLYSYDPAKTGYLLTLIERGAAVEDGVIQIVCVDTPIALLNAKANASNMPLDKYVISKAGLAYRDDFMAARVLENLEKGEKGIVLVGRLHFGLPDILNNASMAAVYLGTEMQY